MFGNTSTFPTEKFVTDIDFSFLLRVTAKQSSCTHAEALSSMDFALIAEAEQHPEYNTQDYYEWLYDKGLKVALELDAQ